MFAFANRPEDVQYMGRAGDSRSCLLAVDTIVNSQNPPRKASVVTWMTNPRDGQGEQLFLFWDWNELELTVVHSGFASGYPGTGPRSYSQALCMIWDRDIPTNYILVAEAAFKAIESRNLTATLIARLRNVDDRPINWMLPDVEALHVKQIEDQTFWAAHHSPRLDFDFLDPELSEHCRKLYPQDLGATVVKAWLVVEERLRTLIGDSRDSDEPPTGDLLVGDKLITRALHTDNGVLTEASLPRSEREGMFLMFKGAHSFVRNPRAHRIVDEEDEQLEIEFIYLADLLLRLLRGNSPAPTRNF